MAEFIGIGDLHLTDQDGQGGLARYIDNHDAYVCSEVDRVLAYAKKHQVKNIFLYGDVCQNPRMSYSAQLEFSRLLRRHSDLIFYIIPGNHDMIGRTPEVGHALELLDEFNRSSNVKYLFRTTDLVIDGVPVRFHPFPSAKFSSKALNVCHLDVNGAISDSGREIQRDNADCSNKVVVSGHIHTNQRVRNTFYSGTLYQTCFGERPEKFFHHIHFESPDDFEILDVPFKPKYRLHTITVQSRDDIPQNLTQRDLVKLVIQDGSVVTAADYQHLNVVSVRTFQSRKQLAAALTEDLPTNGQEFRLSTKEFFSVWLSAADATSDVKASAMKLRKQILASVSAKAGA